MYVNEDDEAYVLFNTTHSAHFPDNTMLMPNGIIPSQTDDPLSPSTTLGDTKADQQSVHVPSRDFTHHPIQIGSTIWYSTIKRYKIAIITNTSIDADDALQYIVHHINGSTIVHISSANMTPVNINPIDIPLLPKDVDNQLMTKCMLSEERSFIWLVNADSTIGVNDRVILL